MGIVSTGVAKTKTKRRRLVLSCGHLTDWRSMAVPVPFLTICEVCTGPRKPRKWTPRKSWNHAAPGSPLSISKADPMTRHKVVGYRDISGQWVYSFKELKAANALDMETVRNACD